VLAIDKQLRLLGQFKRLGRFAVGGFGSRIGSKLCSSRRRRFGGTTSKRVCFKVPHAGRPLMCFRSFVISTRNRSSSSQMFRRQLSLIFQHLIPSPSHEKFFQENRVSSIAFIKDIHNITNNRDQTNLCAQHGDQGHVS
jgi:hypothetical protein